MQHHANTAQVGTIYTPISAYPLFILWRFHNKVMCFYLPMQVLQCNDT